MEKVGNISLKELKEYSNPPFTPLVIVARRRIDSEDTNFVMIDITCESDSRIYQASKLGRFEYQRVNILRVSGVGAYFYTPPNIEYRCFWLLPVESLTGKVYLRGHTSEKLEYERKRFRT